MLQDQLGELEQEEVQIGEAEGEDESSEQKKV